MRTPLLPVLLTLACTSTPGGDGMESTTTESSTTVAATTLDPSTTTTGTTPEPTTEATSSMADSTTEGTTGSPDDPPAQLEVRFLGVGGFSFRVADDLVLTAPMYSNPDILAVQFGDIAADPARVDEFLSADFVADASAILVGHAHYDHLIDVPLVHAKAPNALVFGNTSMRHLMRAAGMADDTLVALDDPATGWTDRRMCPDADVCTGLAAGNEGAWFEVPGASVRTRGLCSTHPDQIFGVVHFAEGCVDAQPEVLPTDAGDWKEGGTIAYLVDFFAPGRDVPIFRVYVQDAPTDAPIGHPHPDLLTEKRIDLAVVNVGSWQSVEDHPGAVITAVDPRYVVAGHWEDFFSPQGGDTQPIPFQADPMMFDEAALAALGDDDEAAFTIDGVETEGRYHRPVPGTDLVFVAE
jgi:L-ascorbate metabolism protein UlaG (beta-lactamase superfamily)